MRRAAIDAATQGDTVTQRDCETIKHKATLETQRHRDTERQRDAETERQRDRETERQRDKTHRARRPLT
jgi:hypothetical protein